MIFEEVKAAFYWILSQTFKSFHADVQSVSLNEESLLHWCLQPSDIYKSRTSLCRITSTCSQHLHNHHFKTQQPLLPHFISCLCGQSWLSAHFKALCGESAPCGSSPWDFGVKQLIWSIWSHWLLTDSSEKHGHTTRWKTIKGMKIQNIKKVMLTSEIRIHFPWNIQTH